ncbi:phosphopantetheine-binding protein [Micromonospora sp. NPDC048999]|uniref:acyl carrier protein n=1 Tax=Micromonospora sp. NPDC048999 TaxID=3155391 RepID=UPI0033E16E67
MEVKAITIAPEMLDGKRLLSAPEIGVDSLSLLELIVRIEREFGIQIPDQDVFAAELRTIDDLTALVETHLTARQHQPGKD